MQGWGGTTTGAAPAIVCKKQQGDPRRELKHLPGEQRGGFHGVREFQVERAMATRGVFSLPSLTVERKAKGQAVVKDKKKEIVIFYSLLARVWINFSGSGSF